MYIVYYWLCFSYQDSHGCDSICFGLNDVRNEPTNIYTREIRFYGRLMCGVAWLATIHLAEPLHIRINMQFYSHNNMPKIFFHDLEIAY